MRTKLPKRSEVSQNLTWNLEEIYPDTAAWEAELAQGIALSDRIAEREGHLAESAAQLLETLQLYEAFVRIEDRVGGYAFMRQDEDTADPARQQLFLKAQNVSAKAQEKLAFLEPEILEIPEETLQQFYKEETGLAEFQIMIREIRRQRAHALPVAMERLLASAQEMASAPHQAFGMLANADLKFPSVTDAEGNEVQITNGRFVPLQMSPDRALRKETFEKFYTRYAEFKNTWAALYDGQVRQQIFYARARKYASTFEAAVDGNHVDPAVCDNLFDSVHRNLDKMHRYVALRKKLLGVDELHMYDVYTPMIPDYSANVTYDEAKEISLKALAPLGEEYLSVVKEAYENRWIDVVENEGKRGGAYSSGVYDVHPYMLLNYNNTLDDVFTLVHEMGHSMHTWYSNKNQNILNARYKIFVAEEASTTNEILLLEYLLGKAGSRQERAYLINHYLESFKSTLYRQTMFEEFERRTNAMAEAGTPLTAETLSETYYQLNKEYFGPAMVSDPLIAYEWCRIPHFYYNFYVYQYATSFAASVAIAHRILEQGEAAVKPYLEFLSSGCTNDPVSLLKIAGVDLSTAAPIDEALEVFGKAIEEMEKLMEEE